MNELTLFLSIIYQPNGESVRLYGTEEERDENLLAYVTKYWADTELDFPIEEDDGDPVMSYFLIMEDEERLVKKTVKVDITKLLEKRDGN